jgi:hypothetical protein
MFVSWLIPRFRNFVSRHRQSRHLLNLFKDGDDVSAVVGVAEYAGQSRRITSRNTVGIVGDLLEFLWADSMLIDLLNRLIRP